MTLLKNPSHPGEVLAELYLEPLGMSAISLAKRLNVPRTRIERLLKGETALSVDTAMRLSKFFRHHRRVLDQPPELPRSCPRPRDRRPLRHHAPRRRQTAPKRLRLAWQTLDFLNRPNLSPCRGRRIEEASPSRAVWRLC